MNATKVLEIPLADIEIGPNVRQVRDKDRMQAIALSARTKGILVPLEVEPGEAKPYRLLDGWHRIGVCEMLGLATAPARIREACQTPAERIELQFCINTLRGNLNPMERAQAAVRLINETGKSQAETAASLGMKEASFSRLIALCRLPEWIQDLVAAGKIPADTAYKLSRIEDSAEQERQARAAAAGTATRDDVSRQMQKRPRAAGAARSPQLAVELGGGHGLRFTGPSLTFDGLIEQLERFTSRAKKYQRKGVELAAFISLLNAEARAEVAP
jgi:ParB/RepB/Spo0J family partition protein